MSQAGLGIDPVWAEARGYDREAREGVGRAEALCESSVQVGQLVACLVPSGQLPVPKWLERVGPERAK